MVVIEDILSHISSFYETRRPLTEEIRLEIFGSRDLSLFLRDFLSDEDSVYTRENLYENLGTPRYSLLHLECHSISFSNLNVIRLFSTECGNRDAEN